MRADAGVSFPALPKTSSPLVTTPRDRSLGLYADHAVRAAATRGLVGAYARMLLNPFTPEGCRYPDDTIVPTALVRLASSTTYVVSASGDLRTYLYWKARTGACISLPVPIASASASSDYGAAQSAWAALDAVDRTLAMGIRVRVVGLPASVFLPAGTLYFLQNQSGELSGTFDTEAECIQAVTARKGFSLTLNELNSLGAVHIPYLPQGAMSFVFSEKDSVGASQSPSGAVAANGYVVVQAFGLPAGATLRFDYSHHVEYIPSVPAAGLVATAVQLPSATARDQIAAASQVVQSHLGGSTTPEPVRRIIGPGSSGSPSILDTIITVGQNLLAPGTGSSSSSAFKGLGGAGAGSGAPAWLTSAMSLLSA